MQDLDEHVALTASVSGQLPGPWSGEHEVLLRELQARREAGEPLGRVLGRVQFRGLELAVGDGVFLPQPETSAVVDAVVAHVAALPGNPVVVDLCTGGGTVALSVAAECPHAHVRASDLDPVALGWARRNAERLGLDVPFVESPAVSSFPDLDGQVDVVTSNPPYVADHELAGVDPGVRDHDPHQALVSGPDGLDAVREVEQAAWRLLRPGGLVVVEHSDRQGSSAPAVFAPRWLEVQDRRDQFGDDRFVTARRP
ncbi:release factor glutamine methyltransferase [Motilibacter peucedani]|uniref:peptide chain release factor N(5)-glutamine methyltransferase n=1 Tax=Motilibacter peucedani TaxID=598650 RepID=A0A420XSE1_9ACTN|nr:peptide chain release factor N(5)-glutamine methyltransferase [Motilibacter peucedani]RKS77796.1 release factor glutamine methyltransferase [Motilibacter peucedani]